MLSAERLVNMSTRARRCTTQAHVLACLQVVFHPSSCQRTTLLHRQKRSRSTLYLSLGFFYHILTHYVNMQPSICNFSDRYTLNFYNFLKHIRLYLCNFLSVNSVTYRFLQGRGRPAGRQRTGLSRMPPLSRGGCREAVCRLWNRHPAS